MSMYETITRNCLAAEPLEWGMQQLPQPKETPLPMLPCDAHVASHCMFEGSSATEKPLRWGQQLVGLSVRPSEHSRTVYIKWIFTWRTASPVTAKVCWDLPYLIGIYLNTNVTTHMHAVPQLQTLFTLAHTQDVNSSQILPISSLSRQVFQHVWVGWADLRLPPWRGWVVLPASGHSSHPEATAPEVQGQIQPGEH